MKQKILITGIAGSGKSTVCQELITLGYEAYDIEDLDGMFAMYKKGTKELFEDYDNSDPDKIKNADWLCDISKLKELLNKQEKEVAFYSGVASNMDEIVPLFDKLILLSADKDTLHKRLSSREGTEDIGNTEEGRQTVLGWKDWWEGETIQKGAVVIDANDAPNVTAQKILTLISPSVTN